MNPLMVFLRVMLALRFISLRGSCFTRGGPESPRKRRLIRGA
jgi:hypothetical protein